MLTQCLCHYFAGVSIPLTPKQGRLTVYSRRDMGTPDNISIRFKPPCRAHAQNTSNMPFNQEYALYTRCISSLYFGCTGCTAADAWRSSLVVS